MIDVGEVRAAVDEVMFDGIDMMRTVDATDDAGNPVTRFYTYPPMRGPKGELVLAFADITPDELQSDDFDDVCIKVVNRMVETGEKLMGHTS